jgi:hypothetical protein
MNRCLSIAWIAVGVLWALDLIAWILIAHARFTQ